MKILKSIACWFILTIGKIHWPTHTEISVLQKEKIRELIRDDYFIILTRRNNHLSTYFVSLANLLLRGEWGYWSHALMNLEDQVHEDKDFRIVDIDKTIKLGAREKLLIESTGEGTHVTPFEKVFDVHGVVLLKPKCMDLEEWTTALDTAMAQVGKPYDSLFNLADDKELSCVELVRVILKSRPQYDEEFKNFEALIKKHKNLSPQMYYDCGDFEVVYEAHVRHK